jgi:hypothetical protein
MSDYTDYRSPLGNAAQEIAQHVLTHLDCEFFNAGYENKLCSPNFEKKLKGKYKDTSLYRHIRFILDYIAIMRRGTLLNLEIKGSVDNSFSIEKTSYDTYIEKDNAANILKKHGIKLYPPSLAVFVSPDNVQAQYIHKLKFQEGAERFWSNSLSKYVNLDVLENDKHWNNPYALSEKLLDEYKKKTGSSGNVFARIDKKASNLKKLIPEEYVQQYREFYLNTLLKHKVSIKHETLSKLLEKLPIKQNMTLDEFEDALRSINPNFSPILIIENKYYKLLTLEESISYFDFKNYNPIIAPIVLNKIKQQFQTQNEYFENSKLLGKESTFILCNSTESRLKKIKTIKRLEDKSQELYTKKGFTKI